MFAQKGLVKDVSGSCLSEMNTGYKITEYRRNCSLLNILKNYKLDNINFIWGVLFFGFTRVSLNFEKEPFTCLILDISSDVALSFVTNLGVEIYS